jgi:hypothetical protein
MPIVGMAADGLGFYLSHFAKPLTKKPKRVFIGLVKVIEGVVLVEDLERDLIFISLGVRCGRLLNVILDFWCNSPPKNVLMKWSVSLNLRWKCLVPR